MALLDHDEDRPLSLLMKQLGVGLLGTGGHAPVNGAHIVAGLVDPHLIEIHAASAQLGVVQADQRATLAWRREQLYFTHAMAHLDQLRKADADARYGRQWVVHGWLLKRQRRHREFVARRGPDQCRPLRLRTTG